MEMCRVCVLPESNLIALDESFVFNYNLLTNLNVKLDDGLPQYCCQRCADAVKYFIDFREKSIEREHTLKDVIKAIKPNKDVTEKRNETDNKIIKFEMKIEEPFASDDTTDNVYEDLVYEDESFNVKEEKEEGTLQFLPKVKQKEVTKRKKMQRKAKDSTFLKNKKKVNSKGSVTGRKKKRRALTVKGEICEGPLLFCGICEERFVESTKLVSHLESHKTNKECSICDEKMLSWPQLFGHRLQHLPDIQQRCHLCRRRYQSEYTLEFHYLNKHNDGKLDKILKCNVCTHTCDKPKKMQRHMLSQHSDVRFYCDYCSKGYANKGSLKLHIFTHHSERKDLTCDVCDYTCKSRGGLRTHKIKVHAPFKLSCKKCYCFFDNQERFDKHFCKDKVVICPICGIQRIGGMKQLQRHLDSHRAVGRYKCDRCPAIYKTRNALKTHIDQHNGTRTKKCEYCPATFFHTSVLTKHRRIHTGEKPYVCKVCSKSFTGNNNLKVHMRVHGEFLINKKNKEEVTSD